MCRHQGVPVTALSNNPVTLLLLPLLFFYIWGKFQQKNRLGYAVHLNSCTENLSSYHRMRFPVNTRATLLLSPTPLVFSFFFIAIHFLLRNLWPLRQFVTADEGSRSPGQSAANSLTRRRRFCSSSSLQQSAPGVSGLVKGSGQYWLSRLTSLERTSETNTLKQPA